MLRLELFDEKMNAGEWTDKDGKVYGGLSNAIRHIMRDNAAQHFNHIHFWKWMKKGGGGDKIPGKLEKQLTADIGPMAKVKEDFSQAGITQFGSGWCWLAVKDGKIVVMKTPNGENPLVHGAKPILGCDVWEHSYYIDYRNRRPDYLKAFLDHLVNWDYVAEMYEAAMK